MLWTRRATTPQQPAYLRDHIKWFLVGDLCASVNVSINCIHAGDDEKCCKFTGSYKYIKKIYLRGWRRQTAPPFFFIVARHINMCFGFQCAELVIAIKILCVTDGAFFKYTLREIKFRLLIIIYYFSIQKFKNILNFIKAKKLIFRINSFF